MTSRSMHVWYRGRFAIGVVGLLTSVVYLWDASGLAMGSLSQPGPKLFPMAIGVLFAVFSVAVMVQALLRRGEMQEVIIPHGAQLRRLLIVAAALVAFAVSMPLVGFLVSCPLFCLVTIRTLGAPSWTVSLLASIGLSVATFLLFVTVLGVPLPTRF